MPEDVIAAPDTDVLAGEYVLGTLDPDERASAHNLIAADAAFAAKVKIWERRLGELHLMGEPTVGKQARPEAPVAEAPVKPPATAPAPLPSFIAPKAKPTAATLEIEQKLRSVRRHLAGWRVLAAVMALALVALGALVAVWR